MYLFSGQEALLDTKYMDAWFDNYSTNPVRLKALFEAIKTVLGKNMK